MHRRKLFVWLVSCLFAAFFLTSIIFAASTGRVGMSGNPDTGGTLNTCSGCHVGGTAPTVTFEGPQKAFAGVPMPYSMVIADGELTDSSNSSPAGGFNVASSDGVLSIFAGQSDVWVDNSAETNNRNEITHSLPKAPNADQKVIFDFMWTPPITDGMATLYGVGNGVNGNGNPTGDAAVPISTTIMIEIPSSQIYLPIIEN